MSYMSALGTSSWKGKAVNIKNIVMSIFNLDLDCDITLETKGGIVSLEAV